MLPTIASLIDEGLRDGREHYATLLEGPGLSRTSFGDQSTAVQRAKRDVEIEVARYTSLSATGIVDPGQPRVGYRRAFSTVDVRHRTVN